MFRSTGTPIAYSAKSAYRFVLSDRNREIAIGDIVKAPIVDTSNVAMKFNKLAQKDDAEDDDEVQVMTHEKVTSHYVGIVRYLGTSTKMANSPKMSEPVVTCLGLELMDPIGNCDGTMFDHTVGDYVKHFSTPPKCGVFVSAAEVVKITPADLLCTLTDAIQKLNSHIVALSRQNFEGLQQMEN